MTETSQKSKRMSRGSRRDSRKNETVPDVSELVEPVVEPERTATQTECPAEEEQEDGCPPVEADEEEEPVRPTSSRRRLKVTPEELEQQFDQFLSLLDAELEQSRENRTRTVNVKVWRDLYREARYLKASSLRLRKRGRASRVPSGQGSSSGFKKPVQISKQMAKFTGWSPDELKSRVDVTNYICQYIREHNLQNPEDRRQIRVDKKLAKLLDYNPKNEEQPLTYFYLQKKIQPHFI